MTDEEKIKLASQIAINFGIDCTDAKCRIEQAFMNFGEEFSMSTETSDKHVAKAKILIEEFNTYNDLDGIQDLKQYIIAIQNLLSEREKDKKKIQELEEENRIFALEGSKVRLSLYIKENYILKQKIKDKILELEQEDLEIYDTDSEDLFIAKYEQRAILDNLKDLLQESEDK